MTSDPIITCGITDVPLNRILSFNANYSLNGNFSATVVFVDCRCLDDPGCDDLCGKQIQIGIDADAELLCCLEQDISAGFLACFDTEIKWVTGLISSYSRDYAKGTTKVTVTSYFEYLKSKPINTQNFCNTGFTALSTVLPVVLNYYNGTPTNLFCYGNYTNNKICGPVEGNNSLTELAGLAQAGFSNLFVQVGGCLTIDEWKDNTNAVEFIIPPEVVMSVSKADYSKPSTAVIRVRGASLSTNNCGERPITNNTLGPGVVRKCAISGVPTPDVHTTLNNLTGTIADIHNSTYESDLVDPSGPPDNVDKGTLGQDVSTKDLEGFNKAGKCFTVLMKGKQVNTVNEGIFGRYNGPSPGGGGYGGNTSFFNSFESVIQGLFPVPYSAFGLGGFGTPSFVQGNTDGNEDLYTDQESFQQIETVAISPNITDCGTAHEQISNKYIPCKEVLFTLAVRRFQEMLLSINTWNVEIGYMPCVELNQKVQFTVPETEDCPLQEIEGIVGGINVSHGPKGSGEDTAMKLSIMDTACLGLTTYTSGNLIQSMCSGDNPSDLSPWLTSELGLESGSGVSQYLYMYAFSTGTAFANYTHEEMTIGGDYTWRLEYEFLQGVGNGTVAAPEGGAPLNMAGLSGFLTGTFTATVSSGTFNFNMIPFGGDPTYLIITKFVLTRTVLA